jgi:ABC-type uncharacterized transport system substrate-binding protein
MKSEENKKHTRTAIKVLIWAVVSLFVPILLYTYIWGVDKYSPILNDGRRWRIGYYEGGPYKDYQTYLLGLVNGLRYYGWLPDCELPKFKENDNTKAVWNHLSEKEGCEYIEFVKEAYWSSDWYDSQRRRNKLDAVVYLQQQKLDLIIAAGTWAGLDLATYSHRVPTLVISASDPVEAGIVRSPEDSGYDHVHAHCDPERYQKQIRAFYNIVRFKKLGVVYEDSEVGRIYASLSDVLKLSVERGFDVVSCVATDEDIPEIEAMRGVLRCHEELASKVDAVYITAHRGVNPKWMPEVIQPLLDNKIATLAQEGENQVRKGVLLGISADLNDESMGRFHAQVVTRAFHGEKLRNVDQVFEERKKIVINTKTAEMIDFTIPESILEVADTIYKDIQ